MLSFLKKTGFWILGLVVSIFCQVFLPHRTPFDASTINIIFTAITSVVGGVLVFIIAGYIKTEKNHDKTSGAIAIKNDELSKEDELWDFLKKELSFFKENRCHNYTIKARLKEYDECFFQCIIEYQYTKKINLNKLEFKINLMFEEKHFRKKKNEGDVLNFERSIDFDERNFQKKTKYLLHDDIKKLYDITDLKVNVDGDDDEKELPLSMASQDGKRGTELVFSTEELPDKFVGKKVTLRYTVKCILEKTSYVYFDTDLPTKGFSLDFDYGEVINEIDIDRVDFLSSYKWASIGDRPDDQRFRLSREGWIIPRSSFIVIWSEKRQK
jgi:hypothetical protein